MDITIDTPSTGSGYVHLRDKNVKNGLKFLQLDDDSYVTAWVETQDQTDLGFGYQRFDSDGNALASKFIAFETPRPSNVSVWDHSEKKLTEISIEKGQGLNDFSVVLNSTGESLSVDETTITTASTPGAKAENLQIVSIANHSGNDVDMVAAWAEKNDSNTYDIYYQKFDHEGNKVGEALIVPDLQNTRTLSNLTTNEFTLNNSIPGSMDISIDTPSTGSGYVHLRDKNVKNGLKFLQLDDDSYVTAWVETQDQTDLGFGYQRFDSDGNALASKFIAFETPRPSNVSVWNHSEKKINGN